MPTNWSNSIIEWTLEQGRLIADPLQFIEGLCAELEKVNVPLMRLRIGFRTIHPQISVWAYHWTHDTGKAVIWIGHHGIEATSEYYNSPIEVVLNTGSYYHRSLKNLEPETDHALLHEQAQEGGTDYLAIPTSFTDGSLNISNFTTKREEGFSEHDVQQFHRILSAVSPIIEIHATRQVAVTVLNTYVGPRTGERVLNGAIKRGDGEMIKAALWFSDLRDFTPLTETLPPADLLSMLNSYFEALTECVVSKHGEVLRFIGDAILIVFPVEDGRSRKAVCDNALEAAREAFQKITEINELRLQQDKPLIRFGVGLHFGDVIYGNVGSQDRLDFTVMGPAVNRTARLESLTKEVNISLLLSKEMVDLTGATTTSLGLHKMKGVEEPQMLYALEDWGY